jgi:hypothetical protein
MKHVYTISFCLLAIASMAQETINVKQHRFSITANAGLMTSFVEVPEECFYCCFGDCFVPFPGQETSLQPKRLTSLQLGATANFDLNKRHRIGLGVSKGEYGEMEPSGVSLVRRSMEFMGFMARHQYRILSGNRMNLYISNAFAVEKPMGDDSYFARRNGYSHSLGFDCGVKVARLTEVVVSMVGRTSYRGLTNYSFYDNTHRFGGGLMVGLTQKL